MCVWSAFSGHLHPGGRRLESTSKCRRRPGVACAVGRETAGDRSSVQGVDDGSVRAARPSTGYLRRPPMPFGRRRRRPAPTEAVIRHAPWQRTGRRWARCDQLMACQYVDVNGIEEVLSAWVSSRIAPRSRDAGPPLRIPTAPSGKSQTSPSEATRTDRFLVRDPRLPTWISAGAP